MKISTEVTPDRQAIVTVEVDEEQLQTAMQKAAQRVSRVRPMPGYRPGKAPYALVERTMGKEILVEEAIDSLSRSLYTQVLKESDLQPVEAGSLEVVQKEPPVFKYTIPIKPEVKLGDFKSIHMTPGEIEVSDEEVNEVIGRFQLNQATMVPVTRGVQTGDVVTVDVVGGVADSEPVKEKNLRVAIGDKQRARLPFEDSLLGLTPGETREVDFTYPDDYEDETFRGKTAHYSVTLHDIKETQLPELNDEFAQAISQFQTLEQFKGNVRDILRRQKERDEEARFADQVLDAVVAQSEVTYPPVMLEHEVQHQLDHTREDVKQLGLTWDKYLQLSGITEEEALKNVRPQAEKQLKQLLVLGELMNAENVQVTRDEVNADIERRVELAVKNGGSAATARRSYSSRDAKENIEYNLRLSRTIGRMVAMAKGEPVSGMILTPEMVKDQENPIPSGLITNPEQVRKELSQIENK
jgi:trigger factor